MADTFYANGWMNSLMCGRLYDAPSSFITANDINISIPTNISNQCIDIIADDNINNTSYTPIDTYSDTTSSSYDDLIANPMYHIEQFTNPIPNNSDLNTLCLKELNPENHTMIRYGAKINKISSKTQQFQDKTMQEIDIDITMDNKSIEKADKLEINTQEIEIQYIDDTAFDDDISYIYDEEIEINSDSSSTQNTSDGVSDYIPSTLSEQSFYIQSVQDIIINQSDYTNQNEMICHTMF